MLREHDTSADCARSQYLIDALFRKGAEVRPAPEFHEHLRACTNCKRVYERYASAESGLGGRGERQALSRSAEERVLARVLAETSTHKTATKPTWRVFALVPLASAALLIGLYGSLSTPPAGEFQPRGEQTALSPSVAFRVLRVRDDGRGELTVSDLSTTPSEIQTKDQLKLVYTNGDRYRWIQVNFVGSDGRALTGVRQPIEPGVEDRALAGSVMVAPDWPGGEIRAIAVFSTRAEVPSGGVEPVAGDRPEEAVRIVSFEVGGRPGGTP